MTDKPDYHGSGDEIVRLTIENRYNLSIQLKKCCGVKPKEMFRGCTEYFVKCPKCGRQTKMFRHLYEAKHRWNKDIEGINQGTGICDRK